MSAPFAARLVFYLVPAAHNIIVTSYLAILHVIRLGFRPPGDAGRSPPSLLHSKVQDVVGNRVNFKKAGMMNAPPWINMVKLPALCTKVRSVSEDQISKSFLDSTFNLILLQLQTKFNYL